MSGESGVGGDGGGEGRVGGVWLRKFHAVKYL